MLRTLFDEPDGPAAAARAGRLWLAALSAGVAAGVAAWLWGEAIHDWFVLTPTRGPGPPSLEEQVVIRAERESAALWAAVAAGAGLGGALGAAMGLAGRLARRSRRDSWKAAAAAGLVAGVVAGGAAALAAMPFYFHFLDRDPMARQSLVLPLLIHLGLWAPIGAAGGWALGAGLGRRTLALRIATGGLLGAMLGVVVHEVVGALAFPLAMTYRPVSATPGARLLAPLLIAGMTAAGAAALASGPKPSAADHDPTRPPLAPPVEH